MRNKRHKCDNHPVDIDWNLLNASRNPALVCKQCITRKGKRRGQPVFISWLSDIDLFKIEHGDKWRDKWNLHQSRIDEHNNSNKSKSNSDNSNSTYHNDDCYDG